MKLIVDSGSTKATWCVCSSTASLFSFTTEGINPVRDSRNTISDVVKRASSAIASELLMGRAALLTHESSVDAIYFYGAGCLPAYTPPLTSILQQAFPSANVEVESDLLGAARALFHREPGIAAILGTGSNSCLYDGNKIVSNVSPLGWILGDEGSGAVLGRLLVGDVLKRQLPQALCDEFMRRYALTPTDIIDAVYRQPMPNRFLASFVPFLGEHRQDASIHRLLVVAFRSFFVRNILSYERSDLPVSFVGSVAYHFEDELREVAAKESCTVGRILCNPMPEMVRYHRD